MSADGSVTHWLVDAKAGSDAVAQRLWMRYFTKLVRLPRGKPGDVPRRSFDEDGVTTRMIERKLQRARAILKNEPK
jgi:hypothetical protein